MLLTFVSFIIILGVLVFFHELGHYWVARRNGVVVEEFGMGYPPRLVKLFTYDGTDFTINLIPFGGFARMRGEDAADIRPGSFNAASRFGRAATLIAGPLMNGLLAVVLFAFSFMAGFPAPVAYPQIASSTPETVLRQYNLQVGDVLLSAGAVPVQVSAISNFNYSVISQNDQENSAVQNLRIGRDGQTVELPLPAGTTVETLVDAVDFVPTLNTQITMIAEGSPAQEAGLQPGDLFYQVDDTVITDQNPLNEIIRRHAGTEVTLTLLRGEEWLQVPILPRANPPEGQGSLGVGIAPMSSLATLPFLQALWQGVVSTGEYVMLVLQLPVMIFLGQISAGEAELTGPVGIYEMIGGAVSATIDTGLWFPIWRLSAILSAALAVTNMLPLPALDGGRLLFILIETIRGRRVNPEREGFIHMVGFMLLLGLIALITVRDITTTRAGIDWISILGQ